MAFETLPIELNEHIASYLSADKDIANFVFVCRATHNAMESHRCGLWRRLYARKFDVPEGRTGVELKIKYKLRCRALRKTTNWQKGHDLNENRVLKILQELVVDSYSHMPLGYKANSISNNILVLREYVQKSNLLDKVLSCLHRDPVFNPALKTLQLVLFHFQVDLSLGPATSVYGFPYSQKAVYAHPSKISLFKGKNFNKVNIDFLMHTANFFKYHMTAPQAQTLYELFSELKPYELPKAWDSRVHQGPGAGKLGRYWKGSYGKLPKVHRFCDYRLAANKQAYLHDHNDMRRIRTTAPGAISFTDTIDFHDGFQTLELDFSPAANRTPWPKVFETHLKALPPLPLCKRLDKLVKPNPCPSVISFLHFGQGTGPETTFETPPGRPGALSRQGITSSVPDDILPLSGPLTPTFTSPRRGAHYQQFIGSGTDAEPFHCNGILHPLPPQHEIPGWHRITLMKYFEPDVQGGSSSPSSPSSSGTTTPYNLSPTSAHSSNSSSSTTSFGNWPYPVDKPGSFTPVNTFPQTDYEDMDVTNGCWAYEGVVLPGGKVMLGRWWSPNQDSDEMTCIGPFIFWEVDEP